jgi:hypothetical protein
MDEKTKKIKDLLNIKDTWKARQAAAIKNAVPGEHAWFQFGDQDPVLCCAFCGHMQNKKLPSRKCKGKAKIGLR